MSSFRYVFFANCLDGMSNEPLTYDNRMIPFPKFSSANNILGAKGFKSASRLVLAIRMIIGIFARDMFT